MRGDESPGFYAGCTCTASTARGCAPGEGNARPTLPRRTTRFMECNSSLPISPEVAPDAAANSRVSGGCHVTFWSVAPFDEQFILRRCHKVPRQSQVHEDGNAPLQGLCDTGLFRDRGILASAMLSIQWVRKMSRYVRVENSTALEGTTGQLCHPCAATARSPPPGSHLRPLVGSAADRSERRIGPAWHPGTLVRCPAIGSIPRFFGGPRSALITGRADHPPAGRQPLAARQFSFLQSEGLGLLERTRRVVSLPLSKLLSVLI